MHYFTRCICSSICYAIAKPSVGHDSPNRLETAAVVEAVAEAESGRGAELSEANVDPKAIYLLSAIVFGMPTNQQASGVCRAHLKGSGSSNKSVFLYARSQCMLPSPHPYSLPLYLQPLVSFSMSGIRTYL